MKTDEIGRMIRFHREEARLSRVDLADLAGVGKTAIFDIENNKQSVKFATLKKILAALNISIVFESPLMHAYERHGHAKS